MNNFLFCCKLMLLLKWNKRKKKNSIYLYNEIGYLVYRSSRASNIKPKKWKYTIDVTLCHFVVFIDITGMIYEKEFFLFYILTSDCQRVPLTRESQIAVCDHFQKERKTASERNNYQFTLKEGEEERRREKPISFFILYTLVCRHLSFQV